MSKGSKLTPKQQLFVDRYLVSLNATQAAKEAKYSEKTAHKIGTENLQKPAIKEAIQVAMDKLKKRNELDQDWVIKRLMWQADARMSKVAENAGKELILKSDMTEKEMDCLSSYSKTESNNQMGSSESISWRVKDPTKSLELLGKHIGMWNEKKIEGGSEKEDSETIEGRLDSFLDKFAEGQ